MFILLSRAASWSVALMLMVLLAASPGQAASLPAAEWQRYMASFISPEGRVVDPAQDGISHSEGQGYGLLLALAADDRPSFERIWRWTADNLRREDGLFAWRWLPQQTPHVTDWNNATDGDLLLAWALARAGKRWQREDWLAEARRIAERIRSTLIAQTGFGPVLLPAQQGFSQNNNLSLNPSYWVFPAFKALAEIDPDPIWSQLERSGLTLINLTRFGPHQVPPDWVVLYADGRLGLPADPNRRRFGFEAIRLPLYLCWAGLNEPLLLQALQQAWPNEQVPAWLDLATGERAAYPLTLSQRSIRQLIQRCGKPARELAPPITIEPNDYYGSTLNLLSFLALKPSGERP